MINLKDLNKSDLILLQFSIESAIRDRRIEAVRSTISTMDKKDESMKRIRVMYDALLKEVQGMRRHVVIDAYLENIEVFLEIDLVS